MSPGNHRVSKRTADALIFEGNLGGGFEKLLAQYWDINRDSWGGNGKIHRRRRPRLVTRNPKLIVFTKIKFLAVDQFWPFLRNRRI